MPRFCRNVNEPLKRRVEKEFSLFALYLRLLTAKDLLIVPVSQASLPPV